MPKTITEKLNSGREYRNFTFDLEPIDLESKKDDDTNGYQANIEVLIDEKEKDNLRYAGITVFSTEDIKEKGIDENHIIYVKILSYLGSRRTN